jgi:hypothetical protein
VNIILCDIIFQIIKVMKYCKLLSSFKSEKITGSKGAAGRNDKMDADLAEFAGVERGAKSEGTCFFGHDMSDAFIALFPRGRLQI